MLTLTRSGRLEGRNLKVGAGFGAGCPSRLRVPDLPAEQASKICSACGRMARRKVAIPTKACPSSRPPVVAEPLASRPDRPARGNDARPAPPDRSRFPAARPSRWGASLSGGMVSQEIGWNSGWRPRYRLRHKFCIAAPAGWVPKDENSGRDLLETGWAAGFEPANAGTKNLLPILRPTENRRNLRVSAT